MLEATKNRIIKDLIFEIENTTTSQSFEIIGNELISNLIGEKLIHHGVNKDGQHVGYTVDSFSSSSSVVAEYSTDKTYFNKKSSGQSHTYEKIEKDIAHAIKHNSTDTLKNIYLLSSQCEPPSFRSDFNETQIFLSEGERVIFFDAREIAKLIYDQSIRNHGYATFFKEYFPIFSLNLDKYEYYGILPPLCENHVSEPNILNAIDNHFKNGNNICILHGFSGSGKTQAVIDYIRSNSKNFENYIWVTGEDLSKSASCSSIKRTRGGTAINIIGMFKSSKTILVIDNMQDTDYKAMLSELSGGFNIGSIVLATSQISKPGDKNCLTIPSFSNSVACQIIGENSNCDNDLLSDILRYFNSSPLILSLIRTMIELQNTPRQEIYNDVLDDFNNLPDDNGKSVIQRIFKNLDTTTTKALKMIANSGSTTHDLHFLHQFITIFSCIKLQQLSILMTTNTPNIVKIHDLVYLSMQDNDNLEEVTIAIANCIEKRKGEMTPSILRQIHLCHRQLLQVVGSASNSLNWLTYALFQIEGEHKKELSDSIRSIHLTSQLSLAAVMCIIEAKEIYAYSINGQEEASSYFNECAEIYKTILEESTDDDIKAELLHHRGKALRRCREYDNAYQCFLKVLELKPNWHATYGQIIALGVKNDVDVKLKEAGEVYMRKLLEEMLKDTSNVPLRISLAAIAKLRSYHNVSTPLLQDSEKVNKLADIIRMATIDGLDQIYESFLAFTSIFRRYHDDIRIKLTKDILKRIPISSDTIDKEQWINACEAFVNIAIEAKNKDDTKFFEQLLSIVLELADKISLNNCLNPFKTRAISKSYTVCGEYQKALDLIFKVPEDNVDYWLLYEKTNAQCGLGEFKEALISIDKTIELAQKDRNTDKWIYTYYDKRSSCNEKLGDITAALNDIDTALNQCDVDTDKQKLLERRDLLSKQLGIDT